MMTLCRSALLLLLLSVWVFPVQAEHEFNGPFRGRNLDRIAFPIGGIGAGMYCLEGTGTISHVSVRNQMDFFNEPPCFAALCVLGEKPEQNKARVLEGPIPDWKYFGRPNTGNGGPGTTYGLPRFKDCTFSFRFPFATIDLHDPSIPIDVQILGWSPFTPGVPDPSSCPVGAIEYKLTNTSNQVQKTIFSFNTPNFMNGNGSIASMEEGFVLCDKSGRKNEEGPGFAFFVQGENGPLKDVTIDHCWFRGGWWDALTIAWDNVEKGRIISNPPTQGRYPGATLAVPIELKPGESRTIRLLTTWYVPESNIAVGVSAAGTGPAFDSGPATGAAQDQQRVVGFLGKKLINTFHPGGDGRTGTLISPKRTLDKKQVHFLIGGGTNCYFQLEVDGKVVRSTSGLNTEMLEWESWDVAEFKGKEAVFKVLDQDSGGWGHILLDHIIVSDLPISSLKTGDGNAIVPDSDMSKYVLIADFEGDDFGNWIVEKPIETVAQSACPPGQNCEPGQCEPAPKTYQPWYASKFKSIGAVSEFWKKNYDELKKRSELFSKTFYDSTLPPEVIEAVAANMSILKTPTVLRQHDGRLWCWEGCSDQSGCCAGSCTHVWNYAQAIAHLFPSLERSLRETEFFESTELSGRQAFRANLPISPGGVAHDASDGQLGGIMKLYREWKIMGDKNFLIQFWPRVKLSLDYMIGKYDPRHTGLLEEDHHNTYDINYFGPDGHCGSFYLGALCAAIEMGDALGVDVALYKDLLDKGKARMMKDLYNGEYFIQIVQKEGLDHNFRPINVREQSPGYREIAGKVNEEGPKYQYGTGCLSDGVLGLWIAKTAGIDTEIIPVDRVKSHLLAVFKYNFRSDLSEHANPQRPTYAMGDDAGLLLCTWPNGGKPLLPFVYSDEVWTGIEYQVASHLLLNGCVQEGLAIVKAVRNRHNGVRRNPFNEYECGHWYARAMSSYGLLQGLTGVRYEPGSQTLFVDSQVGDFRTFLSTDSGFGTVEFKNGKATVETKWGKIPVKEVNVR